MTAIQEKVEIILQQEKNLMQLKLKLEGQLKEIKDNLYDVRVELSKLRGIRYDD
jgi:predicted nuclease with TOPRIM domain